MGRKKISDEKTVIYTIRLPESLKKKLLKKNAEKIRKVLKKI